MSSSPRPPMKLRFRVPAPPSRSPVHERHLIKKTPLIGASFVRRAIPQRDRRLIGGWCFLDHMGPGVVGDHPMDVPAHPHIGLQTVTWLLHGALLHRDSVGSAQLIRPGQLNWMTAGRGIVHAEEGRTPAGGRMHGVQLWVALPNVHQDIAPAFEHHPVLPRLNVDGMAVTLLAGELDGQVSPATTYSPLFGAEVTLPDAQLRELPLNPDHEYGVVVLEGEAAVDGEDLNDETLLYLGMGRSAVRLAGKPSATAMVIGGAPLGEDVLLWWNFVFTDPAQAAQAREDWAERRARFPGVPGYDGGRLPAPPPFRY
ncbi:MAG: pirin family protein [Myxococcota bacterium]